MPTDLPPPKKPHLDIELPDLWLTRTLNWLAVIVGIGLGFYALSYGFTSPPQHNSPSLSTPEVPPART